MGITEVITKVKEPFLKKCYFFFFYGSYVEYRYLSMLGKSRAISSGPKVKDLFSKILDTRSIADFGIFA